MRAQCARPRSPYLRRSAAISLSACLATVVLPALHASASDTGTRILSFTAAPVALNNDELLLPATEVGQSSTSTVTIENQGDSTLTISGMELKGFGRADYAIANNSCVGSLAADETCTLTITFTPTKDGQNLASLLIDSNATGAATPGPGLRASGLSFMSLSGFGHGACTDEPFASGDGSADNPYVIETIAHFNCISAATDTGWRDYLSKSFILRNDLDGQGLEGAIRPVGNWNTAFTGTFDGQGHTIAGFAVDDVWAGLFPWLDGGASIRDLVVRNANVSTVFEGGILSAYSEDSHFEDIVIDGGSLTASAGNANGGAVGYAYGGTMSRVSSSASVTALSREGGAQVGGLLGVADRITIAQSTATGPVSVTFDDVPPNGVPMAGGFVGGLYATTIEDSYASGAVTIVDSAVGFYGGFAGSVEEAGSLIERSYSTGAVTLSGNGATGGFMGRTYQAPDPVTISVFWDTQASGQVVGIGLNEDQTMEPQGLTSEEMQSRDSYIGWAIEQAPVRGNTWTLLDGVPPVLSWTLQSSLAPTSQTIAGTVGTPIAATSALSATWFSGDVSYAVYPPLPAGLSLNSTSGVISGTPTAVGASTVHTITGSGSTSGSATSSVTVSIAAAATSTPAAVPAAAPVSSESSVPSESVAALVSAPIAAAPSTGVSATGASNAQLPAGITRLAIEGLGAPRVVRSLGTTIADAPKVVAKTGAPVNIAVRGLVPGTTHEVRMRTVKGAFTSFGTAVAGSDGSMRLPAWSARKGVKATIAIVGSDGRTAYLKVEVAPRERMARTRR